MKIIKIFAIGAHTLTDRVSGTDYARVLQPMKYLNGYTTGEYTFEVTVYDPKKDEKGFDWIEIFKENDVVYFNYTSNDTGYAVMGTLAQKYGRKLICDIDDDLFNILTNNPAYETFKKGAWGRTVVKAILGDVHHVVCTNDHLKNSLLENIDKKSEDVTVIPNYVDLDFYTHRSPFKDRGYYKALHFGSSTHHGDLYTPAFVGALSRVMKEYPNFTFSTMGSNVPKFKEKWGQRYEIVWGHPDLVQWRDLMGAIMDDTDFILVPLENNIYTRGKSFIKYLESSSFKIPGVYQDIKQYRSIITDGKDGLLAKNEDEWYEAIVQLITDSNLRKSLGDAAFERIKGLQIQDHISEYANMIIKVLDNKKDK